MTRDPGLRRADCSTAIGWETSRSKSASRSSGLELRRSMEALLFDHLCRLGKLKQNELETREMNKLFRTFQKGIFTYIGSDC